MSGTEIFWFILIMVMFFPALQQRLLSWNRQRVISNLEKQRDSRVILLVHRQETMRFLGFPVIRYIDINDSEEILKAVHTTEEERPIDLVLHTPGGLVLPSMQIARALKSHPAKVTVFVPHYAMSGGTLIALAADEIVMSPHAVLGPMDPQIAEKPAASIRNALRHKPLSEVDDQTLIEADVAGKATRQLKGTVRDMLPSSLSEEDAEELADVLTRGTWTHDFPLFAEVLEEFHLSVSTEFPSDILQLMSYYSQPVRREGGVEYVPTPHGREGPDRGN